MDQKDEYELNVREAQRMAENSITDADKAAWLRIAQQWLRMLRGLARNRDQAGRSVALACAARRRIQILSLGRLRVFVPCVVTRRFAGSHRNAHKLMIRQRNGLRF